MTPDRRSVLKGIGAGTAAPVGGVGTVAARQPGRGETIVDVAVAADGLNTLVAAVAEAGLVNTLDGTR